jgi:ketosteroid isomerase-like protein
MSREDVEAVQRAWEAWERGDMDALFRFYDPDIEWDQTHYSGFGFSAVYKGHEGVKQFFREWLSSFEDYWARPQEFIDAGDCVVVRVTQGGRGKGSGIPVEMAPYHQLYRLRGGRAVRIEVYRDERQALEAAGLLDS